MVRSIWVAMFSIVMSLSAAAHEKPQIGVVIYNDAGVSAQIVEEAKKVAGRIYLDAGFNINWQHPSSRVSDGLVFSVRIVRRSLNLPGDDFGIAFVGTDGRGVQADVFYSGIERFASHSSAGPAEILGHVIAHELGHLLLGINSHSTLGVMQAHWQQAQLRQMRMGALRFEKRQAEAICARLNSPAVFQTVAGLTEY